MFERTGSVLTHQSVPSNISYKFPQNLEFTYAKFPEVITETLIVYR
jgi:hypothetical protein